MKRKVKITCSYCGKEKWVDPCHADQKFCSQECSHKGRTLEKEDFDNSFLWRKYGRDKWVCPYSEGVTCERRICSKCGWYPDVAKARLEDFRKTGKVHVD
jgi:hypothetical protein